jgi:circadian clock protein KaiC
VRTSGLPALDQLLGGGLAVGTSTLVLGAAGTGKSSLATLYACGAAARGEGAAIFIFDESISTFIERSAGLGMDVASLIRGGKMTLRQVDPAELSPGEFAHAVRAAAEEGAQLLVIDSLNGYLNAMPSERYLALHLHELLTCLGQRGVSTIMLMTQHGLSGSASVPLDASYLSDTVLFLRYFEACGELRQAISVIKKRTGVHEKTIRELRFANGIIVGDPITDYRGILINAPQFVGASMDQRLRGAEPDANT